MGYTKRQFVAAALRELGLASYVFDTSPEVLQDSMATLDALMAEWNGRGIRLGYPIGSNPDNGDLDEQTLVPDWANEAIRTNLAIRVAPSFGKTVSMDTRTNAKNAYNTVLTRTSKAIEMQLPADVPSGAGNKPWATSSTFLPAPSDRVVVGPDDTIDLD